MMEIKISKPRQNNQKSEKSKCKIKNTAKEKQKIFGNMKKNPIIGYKGLTMPPNEAK